MLEFQEKMESFKKEEEVIAYLALVQEIFNNKNKQLLRGTKTAGFFRLSLQKKIL